MRYEGVSKIFRTDTVKIINFTTGRIEKLPTSTQLRATWHTDSLDIVILPSTGAWRYHNCCIDNSTSPQYFEYTLVVVNHTTSGHKDFFEHNAASFLLRFTRAFRIIHMCKKGVFNLLSVIESKDVLNSQTLLTRKCTSIYAHKKSTAFLRRFHKTH
jgi:hypothetical protein